MSQRFSAADVASHKTANDLWLIVDQDVYDVTKFQDEHPGGKKSDLFHCDFFRVPSLTISSPPTRCWQRRLKAILEVPQ